MTSQAQAGGRQSERQIQKAVLDHWRALGLPGTLIAAIPNQKAHGQYGLTKGLPDLLVLAPGLPLGFIELKTDKGRISEHQESFGAMCDRLKIPWRATFGRDEPILLLEDWGVIKKRGSLQ